MPVTELPYRNADRLVTTLSQVAFLLYAVFAVFGTTLPFQEAASNPDELTGPSPVNQFVFPFIYLLCLPGLYAQRERLRLLIASEKFLTIFMLWCLLTVLWSVFPVTSLKRWIQMAGTVLVCTSFLLNTPRPSDVVKYLAGIFAIFVPLSLLAVALVPAATMVQFDPPAWRGVVSHKNTLGMASLFSAAVWFIIMQRTAGLQRAIAILYLLMSLVLLFGARSATALGVLVLSVCVIVATRIGRGLSNKIPYLGMVYLSVVLTGVIAAVLAVIMLDIDLLEALFALFNEDLTFTGRTALWAKILEESSEHLLLGCGYGGYWTAENRNLIDWYLEFRWLPNQAHQGYLDMLNQTGLIGLSLVTIMGIRLIAAVMSEPRLDLWKWLGVMVLIINLTESTLFRNVSLTVIMFICCYIGLFTEPAHHRQHLDAGMSASPGRGAVATSR